MSYEHLTLEQRYQIAALHRAGSSNKAVAEAVGCHPSTIGRELRRNCQAMALQLRIPCRTLQSPAGETVMGVTTVRLQPEVEAAPEAMACKLHRSENVLIDQAVQEFVFRQDEDQTRWKDTLAAMESVAGGNAIPGESVHAWLRSWGQSDELPPPGVGQ